MAKLILTRGIPASGKSTWAKAYVAEKPSERVRVSRDDIRRMLFTSEHMWSMESGQEKQVSLVVEKIIKQYLALGKTVVLDATNLNAKFVKTWFDIVEDVSFQDFPIREWVALERDSNRPEDEQVGEAVIRNFVQRYRADGKLPDPPERKAPAIHSVEPYVVPPKFSRSAYIVDIDGTLAHVVPGGRSHYDYSRVYEDKVDPLVCRVVNTLADDGNEIILVSGREDSCRYDTLDWLDDKADILFSKLHMRKTGDHRPDDIVKLEIFNEHIRNKYNVLGVFDDRDRVVAMWRSLGLKTFQVAEGNF